MRVCEKHNVSVGIARPHGSQRVLLTQACLHKSDPSSSSSFSAHRGHRWASHSRVLRTVLRPTKSELENLFPLSPSALQGPSGTRVYLVGVICAALDDDGGHSKSRGKRYSADNDDALARENADRGQSSMRDTTLNYPRSDSLMGLIMRRCARACMGKVQRFNPLCHVCIDRITILSLRNKWVNPNRNFVFIFNLNSFTFIYSENFDRILIYIELLFCMPNKQ